MLDIRGDTPMKVYKLALVAILLFCFPRFLRAQNLFLKKIDICSTESYCMDCGDPKATCGQFALDYISSLLNHKYIFKDNASGTLSFQVLVDSTGFSCVLSHSDTSTNQLTIDLIRYLNGSIWRPAVENGKRVNSSVNVVFNISKGKLSGHMQRLDLSELKPAGPPVIYNKVYTYRNESLGNYDFRVWTKYNSPLPDNVGQNCVVDKSNILWYATARGLTRFDGVTFDPVNEYNSPLLAETAVHDLAVDKDNNKWIYAYNSIYMYTKGNWQIIDFKKFMLNGVYRILNSRGGELLFPTKNGLVVQRGTRIVLLNKKTFRQMPSNNVYYAYYDSRKRLWIGTAAGTIMVDRDFFVTDFKTPGSPLKDVYITGATEDENGNIYFSMKACKAAGDDNDKEGIAMLRPDGKWAHFTDKNSGLPSNQVNSLLYDRFEHVLWIATNQSGLVRFSVKDGWENYNNSNSPVPGFEIHQLAQDNNGAIYAATANGMLRIQKKEGAGIIGQLQPASK